MTATARNEATGTAYKQLINEYRDATRSVWSYMNPIGRPSFNFELLEDIAHFEDQLRINRGRYLPDGRDVQVDYVVFASAVPGIYNLGGDLDTFRTKIKSGDRETLRRYAHRCIDNIWNRLNHYYCDITTIALIQGQALGGGFEAALTADVIVAERGSKIGLPEIIFNLFPGMGALSLLSRKVGLRQAQELILSGKTYSAEVLFDMGVVDVLTEPGAGVEAVNEWMTLNAKRRNGYLAVQRAKQQIDPVTYQELIDITDIWVDAAMKLGERDLRVMSKLISAQNLAVAVA